MTKMGYIYLYYGTGGGKTTSALGLALRSIGHKHRVVVVQFMKWSEETGEFKIKDMLQGYFEIRQFGKPGWLRLGMEEPKRETLDLKTREPSERDREAAREGLKYAENVLKEDKTNLLILDEICLAAYSGLLTVSEILKLLDRIPEKMIVVLTGRYAPQELLDRADFVNRIEEVKAPKEFVNEKGIQY